MAELGLDLPITSSDALPLSYRRLVGYKVVGSTSAKEHSDFSEYPRVPAPMGLL